MDKAFAEMFSKEPPYSVLSLLQGKFSMFSAKERNHAIYAQKNI